MKTSLKGPRNRRAKKLAIKRSTTAVRESRVVLFGSATDPEVQASMSKISATGRSTELAPRPNFDTGLGHCGKHLCSCKEVCKIQFAQQTNVAFPGDVGATMGMCY